MGKLIVSLSPHAHGNESVEKNMYGVIIALVPAILASFYFFGFGSAVVLLTSVAACVFFEWAITKYLLKEETSLLVRSIRLPRNASTTGWLPVGEKDSRISD
jgi:Na+-translocating ferredoxin:NAD+ oxidoreductase subunit D